MAQDALLYVQQIINNGALTNNGGATLASATVTAALLASDKKFGTAAAGDLFDFSGAQAVRKLGPTSTTLKDNIAATTTNWIDSNANQINSGGAIISASTNGAKAHGYAGTLTPTLINTMLGTAGTVIWGTIGTANATITMSAAGAFTAQAILC